MFVRTRRGRSSLTFLLVAVGLPLLFPAPVSAHDAPSVEVRSVLERPSHVSDFTSIGIEFTNTGDGPLAEADFLLQFLDSGGTVIGESTATWSRTLARGERAVAGVSFQRPPGYARAILVGETARTSATEPYRAFDLVERPAARQCADGQVDGTVTNTGSVATENTFVRAMFYGADGALVDHSSGAVLADVSTKETTLAPGATGIFTVCSTVPAERFVSHSLVIETNTPGPAAERHPELLRLSPSAIRVGERVTIEVRATPGRTVDLHARDWGAATSRVVRSGVADAGGRLLWTDLRPLVHTTFFAEDPNTGLRSDRLDVNVLSRSSMGVARMATRDFVFHGRVVPAYNGQRVDLFYRSSTGRHVLAASTATDSSGNWRLRRRFTSNVELPFFVNTAATPRNLRGSGPVINVRIY